MNSTNQFMIQHLLRLSIAGVGGGGRLWERWDGSLCIISDEFLLHTEELDELECGLRRRKSSPSLNINFPNLTVRLKLLAWGFSQFLAWWDRCIYLHNCIPHPIYNAIKREYNCGFEERHICGNYLDSNIRKLKVFATFSITRGEKKKMERKQWKRKYFASLESRSWKKGSRYFCDDLESSRLSFV